MLVSFPYSAIHIQRVDADRPHDHRVCEDLAKVEQLSKAAALAQRDRYDAAKAAQVEGGKWSKPHVHRHR